MPTPLRMVRVPFTVHCYIGYNFASDGVWTRDGKIRRLMLTPVERRPAPDGKVNCVRSLILFSLCIYFGWVRDREIDDVGQ